MPIDGRKSHHGFTTMLTKDSVQRGDKGVLDEGCARHCYAASKRGCIVSVRQLVAISRGTPYAIASSRYRLSVPAISVLACAPGSSHSARASAASGAYLIAAATNVIHEPLETASRERHRVQQPTIDPQTPTPPRAGHGCTGAGRVSELLSELEAGRPGYEGVSTRTVRAQRSL